MDRHFIFCISKYHRFSCLDLWGNCIDSNRDYYADMYDGDSYIFFLLIESCLHYAGTVEDADKERWNSVGSGLIMGCTFIAYWFMIVIIMSAMEFFDDKK